MFLPISFIILLFCTISSTLAKLIPNPRPAGGFTLARPKADFDRYLSSITDGQATGRVVKGWINYAGNVLLPQGRKTCEYRFQVFDNAAAT